MTDPVTPIPAGADPVWQEDELEDSLAEIHASAVCLLTFYFTDNESDPYLH